MAHYWGVLRERVWVIVACTALVFAVAVLYVAVAPRTYVALGISGAVQHLNGVHDDARVISVNTDASCPMMARADVAIVADANAVLDALLGSEVGERG